MVTLSIITESLSHFKVIQILTSSFLSILFLQAGIDKVVDREGNMAWLTSHFEDTPLGGIFKVGLMLSVISVMEMAAGILCAIGMVSILWLDNSTLSFWGAVLGGISLTMLFLGQRIAKDYTGAAVLVPYFILTLLSIFILG